MTATLVLAPVITGISVSMTLVRAGSPSGIFAFSGSSAAKVYARSSAWPIRRKSVSARPRRGQVELVVLDAFFVAMVNEVLAEFLQRVRCDTLRVQYFHRIDSNGVPVVHQTNVIHRAL